MKTITTLCILVIVCIFSSVAYAQFEIIVPKWVVTDVPPNESNDRFYNDLMRNINRPALSIVGFDNSNDHSKGYGLKQILNQVYVNGSNEQKERIINMLNISNETIVINPTTREHYQTNSNILQYRAFEALASYVLEQNGVNPSSFSIPMRDHDDALAAFKNDILALSSAGKLANVLDGDYVKNVRTFGNVARALDLYLALENAYKYWDYAEWNNPNSQVLLTSQQKFQLFGHFNDRLENLDSNHVTEPHGLGINEDETEPGNRPLKGYMALGYAALGTQEVIAPPFGPDLE